MDFSGFSVIGLTQSGVILIVVLLVLTDRLVPRRRLDEKDRRITFLEQTVAELTKQNGLLLKSAPLVNSVMGALHRAAGEDEENP